MRNFFTHFKDKRLVLFSLFISLSYLQTTDAQIEAKFEDNKLQNSKFKAREKFYKNRITQSDLSNSDKLAAYDSLIVLCQRENQIEKACNWRIEKSKILIKIGKYSTSFFELKRTCEIIDSLDLQKIPEFEKKKLDCMYNMAKMSLNLGLYDQSVGYLLEILSITNDIDQKIRAYSFLSLLFVNMDKPNLAENYTNKAKKLVNSSLESIDTNTMFIFCNHSGGFYYLKKQYNEAIAQMEKAEFYAKAVKNEEYLLSVYLNLSNIYLSLDERVLSREYLLNVLKICANDATYMHALASQNLAYVYFIDKQYASALKYYQIALDVAQQIDAKKIISGSFIELSDVYKELGDYKKAWEYQKRGYVLKDSVMSSKTMDEIMVQTNNFEQRQEQLEKQILTQNLLVSKLKSKNKTILLSILFLILLVFIVLLCFILKRLFKQEKYNKNLHQTIFSIENSAKDKVSDSTKKLNEDIEFKNRKLTTTSLMLIKANEMVSILKTDVKKLKSMHPNTVAYKEIVAEMDSVLNSHNIDQSWQEFKLYFEQVHSNFFIKLGNMYPDLTQSEQRTCALIFLNLSTKEIASITHRSSRTVETIIYQIRKKMSIPTEEKILLFLQRIFGEEETPS